MEKSQNITRSLFLNASWLFGGKTSASIFSAIQTIIIARMLGISDYGLLVLIIAYVDILNALFDFKVWETATKYIGTFWLKGEKERTSSMIKLSYFVDIASGSLAFLIAIITAKIASKYLIHSPDAYDLICIYAFSLLIDTANLTSDAILRVFDRFKLIAFIVSLNNLIRLALVSIVLYLGMGIQGVLFSFIAASFLGFAVRFWAVTKTLNENGLQRWWKSNMGLVKDQWKSIAWFLSNTGLAGTFNMASDNFLGVLVLGYFSGKEAAAYYKVARSIVKIMTRIMDPLYEAIYPELVRISGLNDLKEFKKLLKSSTITLMKFIVPIAILLLIFSGPIINIVYGEEYHPSSDVLRVLTLAIFITLLTFWINPALLAFGRPGLRNLMVFTSTTIYLVMLFLFVPNYSYLGAAFALLGYAVTNALLAVICFQVSIRREKVRLLKV
ncbi:oligosaccharide flippase family protein [Desulfobacterota bacterium AH_259_B03_O07]|nr:oligosaccharide flippase family protein [Desulfobacterota bacterium AH_259_B03_O07]